MTTSVLDRVPVDEISKRAHEARVGRAAGALATGVLFYTAWVVAKGFRLMWLVLAWCWAAVAQGWHEGRGKQPSRGSLREENRVLRQEIQRLGG